MELGAMVMLDYLETEEVQFVFWAALFGDLRRIRF